MAGVVLDRVWLHLADSPSTFETFWSEKPDDSRPKSGEVRGYAGGRERIVTRARTPWTLGLRLVDVTAGQVDTLESWRGLELLYRDEAGLLVFGAFFVLEVDRYPFGQGFEVALTFQKITSSLPAV